MNIREIYVNKNFTQTWDKITDARIETLRSEEIKRLVYSAINYIHVTYQIKVRVTDAIRTIEEQKRLKKEGKSHVDFGYHNLGLAVDVVEIRDGKALYDNPKWVTIGKAFELFGFDWGGRWLTRKQKQTMTEEEQKIAIENGKGWDKPHFQYTYNKTIKQWQTELGLS